MTRLSCPTPAELTALVAGEAKEGVASHVDACERCTRLVEVARQAVKAQIGSALLADSARDVELLVDSLLELSPEERLRVAAADEYLRAGVARRFSELAIEAWDTDLNVALEYIHVATIIADRLAIRSGRVAELEFEIWKNRSTIHRDRGETDAARACLTKAAAAIDRCEDPDLKRAVVWYAEAAICTSRDVWEPQQALELLARAERIFMIRDTARWHGVRTLRGIIHLHGGEYAAAVEEFAAVLEATDPRGAASLADARLNLANALIRVGRVDEAEILLLEARSFDRSASRPLHVTRADALLACVAEARHQFEVAADGYADVEHRFTAAGEHESALIAGRDLALTLVAMDRTADAAAVLRELLAQHCTCELALLERAEARVATKPRATSATAASWAAPRSDARPFAGSGGGNGQLTRMRGRGPCRAHCRIPFRARMQRPRRASHPPDSRAAARVARQREPSEINAKLISCQLDLPLA